MNPVLVVGDVMMDVLATHRDPIVNGSDTAASIQLGGGGSAANTACWLGAQGETVRLLAGLGDDAFGVAAAGELRDCGVEVLGPVVGEAATGTCVVLVDGLGERTMLPDRGANDLLDAESVWSALAARPGWVHVSAYVLLHEGSRAAGRAAIDGATDDGIVVSVDLASSGPLLAVGPERVLDWISGVDVVFANEDELAAVGGLETLEGRVGSVVVKQGSRGAAWYGEDRSVFAGAPSADLVDTTGAGDALAAGWIQARRSGAQPVEALTAAVGLGARAVAHAGARPVLQANDVELGALRGHGDEDVER